MKQIGILPKRSKARLGFCAHCCEICHRATKRKVRLGGVEHMLCRQCDSVRRRRLRGKEIQRCWQPLFYWIEGGRKRYRCKHGSSCFVIAIVGDQETLVVCTFGYKHELLTAFVLDKELS